MILLWFLTGQKTSSQVWPGDASAMAARVFIAGLLTSVMGTELLPSQGDLTIVAGCEFCDEELRIERHVSLPAPCWFYVAVIISRQTLLLSDYTGLACRLCRSDNFKRP